MLASYFLALLVGASAAAAAAAPSVKARCNVSKDTLIMPSTATTGSTPLATPIADGPKFIGIGVGTQNYTCTSTGIYAYVQSPIMPLSLFYLTQADVTTRRNIGAYAEIFDISCLPEITFTAVTDLVWATWQHAPKSITAADVVNDFALFKPAFVLGQHYFIPNPITGTGLSPKWDFTSTSEAGHANAFVVGAKSGDVPAATNPKVNVDLLSLNAVQGDLAQQVFRVETRGGQPPASVCIL